jgi:8-oxo-dGTP pyrophosphatase MutT (NUDIX family)
MMLDAPAAGGGSGSEAARMARGRLRPRMAASILLLDRHQAPTRVLVGRRSKAHAFMPDLHVFPGGRRDPGDHRIAFNSDLPGPVLDRLQRIYAPSLSPAAARALALAALRELHEETSLVVGPALEAPGRGTGLPFLPDLKALRYVARAMTPPGHVRRFDTHFFALFIDEAEIDLACLAESRELEDLRWVPIDDPSEASVPEITARILAELKTRLDADPLLGFDGDVPFFHVRYGRSIRDLL